MEGLEKVPQTEGTLNEGTAVETRCCKDPQSRIWELLKIFHRGEYGFIFLERLF